jgi:hypothetical protein
MSGARLHAGYTLATAMRTLVPQVRILLSRTLLVFQESLLARCRSGSVLGVVPSRLVLLRHGKSFRGVEVQPAATLFRSVRERHAGVTVPA